MMKTQLTRFFVLIAAASMPAYARPVTWEPASVDAGEPGISGISHVPVALVSCNGATSPLEHDDLDLRTQVGAASCLLDASRGNAFVVAPASDISFLSFSPNRLAMLCRFLV
ncbi:MAG: hypothetical protein AB7N71_12965 [Phycisphaerae bacterium]